MNNFFLDSNICVYAFSKNNIEKEEIAFDLIINSPTISSQVIIETFNACSRKYKIPLDVCNENTEILLSFCKIEVIDNKTLSKTLFINSKYQLSFLDSIIIASALQAGCNVLYSEDMQHNLLIENSLRIINPFL